jgi:hypothetical protein
MLSALCAALLLALPLLSTAVKQDEVRRVELLNFDRWDFMERLSPQEIVAAMRTYPSAYPVVGHWATHTPGNPRWRMTREKVNAVQAHAKQIGAVIPPMCIGFRYDVYRKIGEESSECRPNCSWQGTMPEAFDTDWLMRVPAEVHERVVERSWSYDPFDPGAPGWPPWFDRDAVVRLNTREKKIALYGGVAAHEGQPVFRVSAVIMDLRIPEYRAWAIRRVLYMLREHGIDPGEDGCLFTGDKPGWHTYYAGKDSGDRCFVPGARMWTGPAHVCSAGYAPGGPFDYTQYGPGEYEAATQAFFDELFVALDANRYEKIKLITVERPRFTKVLWSTRSPAFRANPRVLGEQGRTFKYGVQKEPKIK